MADDPNEQDIQPGDTVRSLRWSIGTSDPREVCRMKAPEHGFITIEDGEGLELCVFEYPKDQERAAEWMNGAAWALQWGDERREWQGFGCSVTDGIVETYQALGELIGDHGSLSQYIETLAAEQDRLREACMLASRTIRSYCERLHEKQDFPQDLVGLSTAADSLETALAETEARQVTPAECLDAIGVYKPIVTELPEETIQRMRGDVTEPASENR